MFAERFKHSENWRPFWATWELFGSFRPPLGAFLCQSRCQLAHFGRNFSLCLLGVLNIARIGVLLGPLGSSCYKEKVPRGPNLLPNGGQMAAKAVQKSKLHSLLECSLFFCLSLVPAGRPGVPEEVQDGTVARAVGSFWKSDL